MDLYKSFRNFLFSGIISNSLSRKLINALYNQMNLAQKGIFYDEFAKIFNYRSIKGKSGYWEVTFIDKLIRIPLITDQFWLDWDIAVSILGHETEIVKTYEVLINSSIKPELFIDIGANYGLHSLLFLVQNIDTISFEPNNNCNQYFNKLCSVNYVIPTIEPYALGDHVGIAVLSYPTKDTWLGTTIDNIRDQISINYVLQTENVPIQILDNYLARLIGKRVLIKIDTEGSEFAVLKGAEMILKEVRPYIVFECWKNSSRSNLFNFLEFRNYKIFNLPWSPDIINQPLTSSSFIKCIHDDFIAIPT